MKNDIICPGIYQHYKGKQYEVIGEVTHSETMEKMILYKALYGKYDLWVRPKAMFMETVNVEGRRIKRFTYVGTK